MKARITFPGTVVFDQTDGQAMIVESGKSFSIKLFDSVPPGLIPGSTADKVLRIREMPENLLEVEATSVGVSRIIYLDENDSVVFRLVIDVRSSEEAGSLSFTPGTEEDLPS